MLFNHPPRFVLVAATVAALVANSNLATAQVQPVGNPVQVGVGGPIANLDDIAYNDKQDVYLVVWGIAPVVYGRFVRSTGETVGATFRISTIDRHFAQFPRVAYSTGAADDIFFVSFSTDAHGDRSLNVYGQLIRFNGTGPEFVGGNFPISPFSTNPSVIQYAGGVAFNASARQFMVTYYDSRGQYDVWARLFNVDGTPVGDEVNVSAALEWQGSPNVAYDPNSNRYLVAYQGEHYGGVIGSWGRLLDGTTGQPIGSTLTVATGGFLADQNVTFLPEPRLFLMFWTDIQRTYADASGRLVDSNGGFASNVYPVVSSPVFDGAPDGEYSGYTRTVLVSAMHDTGWVVAAELSANGQVLHTFRASHVAPKGGGGSFFPKVAAGEDGQFGMSYVLDYSSTWMERLAGPVVPGGILPGPPPPPPISATIDLSTANAPNGSWFFAEGATLGGAIPFDTYYLVSNEGSTPAEVRAYASKEDGFTYERAFTVGPHSRKTARLGDLVPNGSYSVILQSKEAGEPIHAERATYWGTGIPGGAASAGISQLSKTWYFAEGSTKFGFFDNYLLIQNPTQETANVKVTYFQPVTSDQGHGAPLAPVARTYAVAKQARLTVLVNAIPDLANSDFSMVVESDQPIVAERSMYWGKGWEGGTNSFGVTAPTSRWYFAEGASATNFETYYTVLNANTAPVTVRVTYLPEQGGPLVRDYAVGANARYTILLNSVLGNVGGIASVFETVGGEPIVVERSIYWGAPWIEGTNVTGTPAPSPVWRLPEGSTAGGFETYLLLSNPNDVPVTVRVTGFREDGAFTPADFTIGANARLTLYMNDANLFPQLQNKSFATRAEALTQIGGAAAGIVAEHAVYWLPDPQYYWRGGSAAFGIPQATPR